MVQSGRTDRPRVCPCLAPCHSFSEDCENGSESDCLFFDQLYDVKNVYPYRRVPSCALVFDDRGRHEKTFRTPSMHSSLVSRIASYAIPDTRRHIRISNLPKTAVKTDIIRLFHKLKIYQWVGGSFSRLLSRGGSFTRSLKFIWITTDLSARGWHTSR